jgi:hypothetical protein
MSEDDDPLAVTEETEVLARQITGRPPVKQPVVPPSTNAAAAASRQQQPLPPPQQPQQAPQQRGAMNIRPRQPGTDDALLTPQELAAAFQLDFGGAPANGAAAGAGRNRASHRPRKTTAVLAVLLLIAAGAAALLYLRPDLRRKASAWGDNTMNSVKTFISSRTSPTTPTPANATPATRGITPGSMATPGHPPMTISPAPPANPPRSVLVSDAPAGPSAKGQVVLPPVPAVPAPAPAPAKTDAAQVANAAVKPDASKPAVQKPPVQKPAKRTFATIDEALDEEKRLWSKAIDAEANQDYVEAVRCYEEIQQLPAEVQPRALQLYLDMAKRNVR